MDSHVWVWPKPPDGSDGLLMEAVSKANYPLMKPDTPDIPKQLGWAPLENESDNWKGSGQPALEILNSVMRGQAERGTIHRNLS